MEDLIASLLSGVNLDHHERVSRPPIATKKRLTGAKSSSRNCGTGRGELVWNKTAGALLQIKYCGPEMGANCPGERGWLSVKSKRLEHDEECPGPGKTIRLVFVLFCRPNA